MGISSLICFPLDNAGGYHEIEPHRAQLGNGSAGYETLSLLCMPPCILRGWHNILSQTRPLIDQALPSDYRLD